MFMKGNINHYRKKPSVAIVPAKPDAEPKSLKKNASSRDKTQVESGVVRARISPLAAVTSRTAGTTDIPRCHRQLFTFRPKKPDGNAIPLIKVANWQAPLWQPWPRQNQIKTP